MKKWYTAKELAGLRGMPKTPQGVTSKAKRGSWPARFRKKKGGGKEYFIESLPAETQNDLYCRHSETLPTTTEAMAQAAVAKLEARDDYCELKGWQRDVLTARLTLYREFERLRDIHGTCKAAERLSVTVNSGLLPEHLQKYVPVANARSGGKKTLSKSTILAWERSVRRHGETSLAPRATKKEKVPDWAPYFHKVYNLPQKPSIPEAMREMEKILPPDMVMPSYYQVRRYHHKRSRLERRKGRYSAPALKRFRGYIRRSTDNLQPLDVVQCDGHSFKAKVAHPAHGRPFKPEVCAVIDVKTKMCMGWSSGLAESSHTVADALRHSMTVNEKKPCGGVPAILYTDKGAGNMSHVLSDEVTGILARAGITHHTGIPGNAQGRGLVEKTNQRLWISAAKKLATFVGSGMDQLTQRRIYLLMEKEVKKNGTCIVPELPPWLDFVDFCEQSVRDYNNTPHGGLDKIRDQATGRIRHMTPAEAWFTAIRNGWSPTLLDPAILKDLFRPQIVRITTRGQVSLFNKIYYEPLLEHYHGEKVIVEYDIHEVDVVRIRDMEQRLLCLAHLDRNKKDFFPVPEVERAREERFNRRKALLERKLEEVEAERSGVQIEHDSAQDDIVIEAGDFSTEIETEPAEKILVPARKQAISIEAKPKEQLVFTKSEQFSRLLAELRESPRPLTPEENNFLTDYYQEEGGRLYLQMVGDLRHEYGVAGDIEATM